MTPVVRLRAAADALDRLAGEATEGPWHEDGDGVFYGVNGDFVLATHPDGVFGVSPDDPDAALIAVLRSLPGPIATWLRAFADIEASYDTLPLTLPPAHGANVTTTVSISWDRPVFGPARRAALAVADAVLGADEQEKP